MLVVSMFDEALYAQRVLRAGGDGYIMKQEDPHEIILAIRDVLAGQRDLVAEETDEFASGRDQDAVERMLEAGFRDERAVARDLAAGARPVGGPAAAA